jgi:hypothetical protein
MSIQLRGGYTTEDPRLDALPNYDEKSRMYGITKLVGDTRPLVTKTYTSRSWLNQRREGACVSFSFHQEAGSYPYAVPNLTDALARERYFDMQREDPWQGGAYPGATPQYEGTDVLTGAKVMSRLGHFKSYHWAFGIDEALLAIIYSGPVIFGIPWLDSMMSPRPNGTLDTTGSQAGRHAIMARGVNVPKNGYCTVGFPNGKQVRIKTSVPLVRFRNSWINVKRTPEGKYVVDGWDWGIMGECLIPADELQRLLTGGQGECCVPTERTFPPK